ncbi:Riboflavin transporter MCH5 [Sphaceloma murrayae]|uniref:Riboflavin transporter MCH5 n=1 Tax=Sphaceloma murrayae TaxID=2082308 RepID=A0A2K1QRZ4_9PEZI|nr:Riboflavin transporter MCH5 [Sphaceloma murrayae]
MATTTATDIELEPVSRVTGSRLDLSTTNDTDRILQASREADSGVPDGGYGWVVIGGCTILTWWFVGTSYCWGVFQDALVKDGLGTASTLAFVGSLAAALMASLATVSGRVTMLLGARYTGMLGIGLIGAAEVLTGFAIREIGLVFVTVGVITGVGMSLCFMVVSVIVSQYFNRKRGLANGIVFAGGGLGGAVTSFLINGLIERVGIAWAYRVLGFLTLATGLPAAWLVKERTRISTAAAFVEWRLFRDFKFAVVFTAGAIATFPLFVPPFFLPLYSSSIGLSSSAGAGLVASFNFSSAVGRIISGLACDRIGALNTIFISLSVSALSMLALWPVSETFAPLIAFSIINGASNGGFFATMPTVVSNVFGSARVGVAMAMIVSGWAAGYLMGAPIAGYILEAYGGEKAGLKAFRPAMFYAGSLALSAAGLVALVRLRITTRLLAKA